MLARTQHAHTLTRHTHTHSRTPFCLFMSTHNFYYYSVVIFGSSLMAAIREKVEELLVTNLLITDWLVD